MAKKSKRAAATESAAEDVPVHPMTQLPEYQTLVNEPTPLNAAHVVIAQLRNERADLAARLARVEAALRPFALAADDEDVKAAADEAPICVRDTHGVDVAIVVEGEIWLDASHLRAAKEAYNALTGEGD